MLAPISLSVSRLFGKNLRQTFRVTVAFCALILIFSMCKGSTWELCDEWRLLGAKRTRVEKKVLTFSLFAPGKDEWVNFQWFIQGTIQNALDAKLYYPEWTVRVYTIGLNSSVERQLLSASDNVEVAKCVHSRFELSGSRAMLTRFLVYDDPTVQYFVSRDSDSRLSPRELFAVNEWISSGLGFHVMRDHPEHNAPVLGGMFGMRRGVLGRKKMRSLLRLALSQNAKGIHGMRGEDQSFLMRYIWPIVRSQTLDHDILSERCRKYGSKVCRSFPMGDRDENSNVFVGAAFKPIGGAIRNASMSHTCAIKCRC